MRLAGLAVFLAAAAPSSELINGIAAYNAGDIEKAFKLLETAANRGEAEALVNLGYMYARGQGVHSDPWSCTGRQRRKAMRKG